MVDAIKCLPKINGMNFMKLVIRLHFISWKRTPNNAVTPQRQSQFTPKMKTNAVPRLLSSLVWIDHYNECNGITSFIEFIKSLNYSSDVIEAKIGDLSRWSDHSISHACQPKGDSHDLCLAWDYISENYFHIDISPADPAKALKSPINRTAQRLWNSNILYNKVC